MGNDSRHAGLVSHLDGFHRLGNGTDLVELDEDGVSCAEFDALGKSLCIRYEKIIAYELNALSESGGHLLPAFPVLFIETVLDADDGIFADQ